MCHFLQCWGPSLYFWSCWAAYGFLRCLQSALLDGTEKVGPRDPRWHGCGRYSGAPTWPQTPTPAGHLPSPLPTVAPRAFGCADIRASGLLPKPLRDHLAMRNDPFEQPRPLTPCTISEGQLPTTQSRSFSSVETGPAACPLPAPPRGAVNPWPANQSQGEKTRTCVTPTHSDTVLYNEAEHPETRH